MRWISIEEVEAELRINVNNILILDVGVINLAKIPSSIKEAAIKGDFQIVIDYINKIDSLEVFSAIKEQKILFKLLKIYSQNTKIGKKLQNCYLNCAERIKVINFEYEYYYFDFILWASININVLESMISKVLDPIISYDVNNAIFSFLNWFNSTVHKQIDDIKSKFDIEKFNELDGVDKEQYFQTYYHTVNAQMVDECRAGARAIYFITNSLSETNFKKEEKVPDTILFSLYNYSIAYNNIVYYIDQVSFGEYIVTNMDWANKIIEFDFLDYELVKARRIGIRHDVANVVNGTRESSEIRKLFIPLSITIAKIYAEIFEAQSGYKMHIKDKDFISKIESFLDFFDFQDELLIFATGNDEYVRALYAVGVSLMCIYEAFSNIVDLKNNENGWVIFPVPFEYFGTFLSKELDLDPKLIDKALQTFCSDIPIKKPHDLTAKPFLKRKDRLIGLLPFVQCMNLHLHIKNQVVKGNVASNKYGSLWEEFVIAIFEENNWRILGKCIKVKVNNKIITDIDLIVEKNGLILLVQAKSISACSTPYEHWQAKNDIIKGINQANLSVEYYNLKSDNLLNLLKSNNVCPESIKIIQPIVIIPSYMFTGWKNGSNVPVMSLEHLVLTLNSDIVKVTIDEQGHREDTIMPFEKLSIDELHEFFGNPYIGDVTTWSVDKVFFNLEIGGMVLKTPDFSFGKEESAAYETYYSK